jgi:hypothetical protein
MNWSVSEPIDFEMILWLGKGCVCQDNMCAMGKPGKRDADGSCDVQIVNLASGDIVQCIRIEGAVTALLRCRGAARRVAADGCLLLRSRDQRPRDLRGVNRRAVTTAHFEPTGRANARPMTGAVDAGLRQENASRQKTGASVLIQSEPIRL